jgi:hypothetical protein
LSVPVYAFCVVIILSYISQSIDESSGLEIAIACIGSYLIAVCFVSLPVTFFLRKLATISKDKMVEVEVSANLLKEEENVEIITPSEDIDMEVIENNEDNKLLSSQ